jgi:hypothetical protein
VGRDRGRDAWRLVSLEYSGLLATDEPAGRRRSSTASSHEFARQRPSELLNSRKTGFEAFYCAPGPAGAHEKGGVEGDLGRFRRRWLVPVPKVASLAELNAMLAEADAAEDGRRIAYRAATVGEEFAAELRFLRSLPGERFETAATLWPPGGPVLADQCRQVPLPGPGLPDRLTGAGHAVSERAAHLRRREAGGGPSAAGRGRCRDLELDHYLEILARKPGALAGSAALAQARTAAVFTSVHEAFWAAARARHGDSAGTRALIEVLLLHRRMPPAQVIAGMRAALAAGSCSADVVAVEAHKHATAAPGGDAETAWQALARPRRSRAAVVTLPRRQDALPPDRRPAPSVAAYDQLLSVPPASGGGA